VAILASWVLAFFGTLIILKILDATMGLRVADEDEVAGLDLSQHSETAYALEGPGFAGVSAHGAFAEAMKPQPKPPAAH